MNTTTTHLTLDDEQMDRITTLAADDWQAAVVETFRCFGVDLSDPDCGPVRPSDYAIPSEQWGRISSACGGGDGSDGSIVRVGRMMDWMNYGPSAFDD